MNRATNPKSQQPTTNKLPTSKSQQRTGARFRIPGVCLLPTAVCLLPAGVFAQPAPPNRFREMLQKIESHARPLLVGVELSLKKSTRLEKMEKAAEEPGYEARRLEAFKETGRTADGFAVRVGADGTWLMHEPEIPVDDIAGVTLIDGAGNRRPARRVGILRNHAGLLLKADDAPGGGPAVEFAEARPIGIGEDYYVATLGKPHDDRWQIGMVPYVASSAPFQPGADWVLDDAVPPGGLLYNADGEPVGIALDQRLWIDADGRSSWIGREILKDDVLTENDREAREKTLEAAAGLILPEVRLEFREEAPEDGARRAPAAPEAREAVLYGLLLDAEGTILVPQALDRDTAQKIDSVTVAAAVSSDVSAGGSTVLTAHVPPRHPAVFVGSFREIGAFVVRCDALKGTPPARAAPEPADLARGRAYLACRADQRFGRRRTTIAPARVFQHEKGLHNVRRWSVPESLRPGSVLFDIDGTWRAVVAEERMEEDPEAAAFGREAGAAAGRYLRRLYGGEEQAPRIYTAAEVKSVLADGAGAFDPLAVPLSREEARRVVWLGVEYQGLTKDLAEALDVQKPTQDGKQGLLVSHVYAGSPAERTGIRAGDILLWLRAAGRPGLTELALPDGRDPFEMAARAGRRRSEGAVPWRTRRNFLSMLLTQIGAGRKTTLGWWSGGAERTAELTLETAPPDFLSAPRFRAEEPGLTVRDLTYEVAYFQRIPLAGGGAVVAKIEPGSPAEVAKLSVSDLIRKVDADPVRDAASFGEALRKCRAAGRATVTLEVMNLGQTRFVDVALP